MKQEKFPRTAPGALFVTSVFTFVTINEHIDAFPSKFQEINMKELHIVPCLQHQESH